MRPTSNHKSKKNLRIPSARRGYILKSISGICRVRTKWLFTHPSIWSLWHHSGSILNNRYKYPSLQQRFLVPAWRSQGALRQDEIYNLTSEYLDSPLVDVPPEANVCTTSTDSSPTGGNIYYICHIYSPPHPLSHYPALMTTGVG